MSKSRRILVISDIHANLDALEAVLDSAGVVDETWCLGDLVGYGPDPNECVQRVRLLQNLSCIMGNHDAAALDMINLSDFNKDARTSVEWLINNLTVENTAYLRSLPEKLEIDNVTLAHGSPRNPIWEYLLDPITAQANLDFFQTQLCFVGHTHVPLGFFQSNDHVGYVSLLKADEIINIKKRCILNPGSVGQPRDNDTRAAYALYLPEKNIWESHRVEYNIKAVQRRIAKAGLPSANAIRLAMGY
jgi:diadenosine tetraphosphatase ApaH/serine/threonine PP2A family protein phosphatase